MKKLAAPFAALSAAFIGVIQLALIAEPASAGTVMAATAEVPAADIRGASKRTVSRVSWVEEWDAERGQWVRVSEPAYRPAAQPASGSDMRQNRAAESTQPYGQTPASTYAQNRSAARYAAPGSAQSSPSVLAQYGPFLVISPTHSTMVGATDSASPSHFAAMLRDFPQIAVLEMVEAPGTSNDIANLAVGRQIRAAGIATYVPRGGSVRSGAVELFLAGVTRRIDDGAEFAVHSWLDNHGREADDFAPDDPTHRLYLDYYVEMGMSEARARDFYDMTNSVPHHTALWLMADDMRYWLRPVEPAPDDYAGDQVTPGLDIDAIAGGIAGQIAEAGTLVDLARLEMGRMNEGKLASLAPVQISYADLSGTSLAQLAPARPQPQLALVRIGAYHP